LTTYVCQWKGKAPDEIEYDEFFVEEDRDPPGKWKCLYRTNHKGELVDHWVTLPKQTRSQGKLYISRQEVLDRDLTCAAQDMTCELVSIERVATEPRLPSLTALALQIERSRAMLMHREPRSFLRFTNSPDGDEHPVRKKRRKRPSSKPARQA
jgi:hypothetical protein